MMILAALVVLSLAARVRPADQETCRQPVLCPCGNTGKQVKVCSEEDDPCSRWSKCKNCQDGLDGCLECTENADGLSCSRGLEKLSRQKRQYYLYSTRGVRRQGHVHLRQGCPELRSPKLGSIRCVFNERERTCVGKCLPGYHFDGHGTETEITLTCSSDHYTPLREFPPCKTGGYCDLIVQAAGSYNCTTGMSGTRCDVICRNQFVGRFFCYPGRPWEPTLPYCVRSKGIQVVTQNCRCENGGRCDNAGNCVCPNGWSGRLCEIHIQVAVQNCRCENSGRCDDNGNCVCPIGWAGRLCETPSPQQMMVYCRDPGVDPNGSRNPKSSPTYRGFPQGSNVEYFCNSGYDLDGARSIFCYTNGRWSAGRPSCKPKARIEPENYCQDPGNDPNGGRNLQSPPTHQGFLEGSRLEYFCNQGYDIDGERMIFCLSSGRWSSQRPTCRAQPQSVIQTVYCLNPGSISNGRVVYYAPLNKNQGGRPQIGTKYPQIPVDGILVYSCNSEYVLMGISSLTCRKNGKWSEKQPVCVKDNTPAACRNPGPIENGRIAYYPPLVNGQSRLSKDAQGMSEFPISSLLLYYCDRRYSLQGSSDLTCKENGEWSAQPPTCSIAYCPNPGSFSNGLVVYHPAVGISRWIDVNENTGDFSDGDSLQYSCNNGYILRGSSDLTCQHGRWSSNLPFCERERTGKPDSACDNPGPIPNGKVQYVPSPNRRRRRPTTNNGEFIEYPEGSRLVYTCDRGYTLHGTSEITCQETGMWSAVIPVCYTSNVIHMLYCRNPGPLMHGKFRYDPPFASPRSGFRNLVSDDTPEFPEGSTLKYHCDDGYKLVGTVTIRCQSTGIWTAHPPECSLDCGRTAAGITRKILNGELVKAGEWPWVVAIAERENNIPRIICGGAVLNTRTVITAAHCLKKSERYILYFGKHYRSTRLDDDQVQNATSVKLIIHPEFNNVTMDSDIALIKFEPKINFTVRVQPICLPNGQTTAMNLEVGKRGYVTGWGENEKQVDSNELMMAHLPFQSNEECKRSFRENANFTPNITQNMFCAGFPEATQSICRGDSGSPFVFFDHVKETHTIEGIVSFTVEGQCGLPGRYSVYTKVQRFLQFIYRNLDKN